MVFYQRILKTQTALKRKVLAAFWVCACTALLLSPPPSYAQNSDEDFPNEFIFEVTLPPAWRIAEAVFAYEENGKYYLPIGELGEGFDFFVETESDTGFAIGFANGEENNFTVDLARNELIIGEKRETLADDAVLISDMLATDDVYVQLEVLNQIWPVDMSIDLSSLKVIVEAEEELPFMRRKDRESKRTQIESRKAVREARRKKLPRKENPYAWFGQPTVDYQAIYRYDDDEDILTGSNIFTGVQQIGKLLAEFSANFRLNEEKELDRPDNIRLRLSRKSAGDEYLVPGIRSFETGDVNLRQRDLISNTENGRGIVISNDNQDRFNEFDEITIEGLGPPGWEIELYNNEELIDFGVVPDNGQFFFEDVVLNFGNNNIKILLFGPQGQVREETRNYTAGGNMLPPGEFIYKAGFLDADREFILLDNEARNTPRGVVKNVGASYGVNRWLSVFGNYAEIPEADKDHNYATAGAVVSTPVGLVEAEAYNEIGAGEAVALDYITTFYGVRTNLGVAKFNDFESQEAGFEDNKKTFEATAQFNKLAKILSVPIGLRLNSRHTERETGDPISNVDFAQTFSRSGLRVTHNTSSRFNDFAHESTNGSFTTTWREDPWQLRGSLNYNLYPESELSSFSSELRYTTEDNFLAAINAGHNFTTHEYNIGAQVGYEFDSVLGSFQSNYERGKGWDFTLRATTSFNPYTPDGNYTFSSRQKRNHSPVRAQVYIDRNADGEFNDGDEPVEGARLNIGFGSNQAEANENGMVIANAPTDELVNISLDTASLADPYLVPTNEGFSTVPARGSVVETSFAVVETGAIEGTVFREDNDRIVAGLTLTLHDENGEQVVDPIVSAFDGFYAFEFVRPGTYSVRVDPSHNVTMFDNIATITPEDLYVYGNDLYIQLPENLRVVDTPKPKAADPYGPFMPGQEPVQEIDPVEAVPPQDVEPAAGTEGEIFGPFISPATIEEQDVSDVTARVEEISKEETAQQETPKTTLEQPEEAIAAETPKAPSLPAIAARTELKAHKDHARLVLEMDKNADIEILPNQGEGILQILLKGKALDKKADQKISTAGKTYIYESQISERGTILTLRAPNIALKRKMSTAGKTENTQRLLIDVN